MAGGRSALDALAPPRPSREQRRNAAHRDDQGPLTKQAILDIAKRDKADLIILGSYREGKYTGAPLGHMIEEIATDAKCDVLIGVEGKHGTLLGDSS